MKLLVLTNPFPIQPVYINFDLVTQFRSLDSKEAGSRGKCIGSELQLVTGKWIDVSETPEEIVEYLEHGKHP